jgi:hypothetical protein
VKNELEGLWKRWVSPYLKYCPCRAQEKLEKEYKTSVRVNDVLAEI